MASACGFVLLWLCGFVAGGYTKVTLCAGLARENGVALSSEQLQALVVGLPWERLDDRAKIRVL
jgi:hypothetical protein